MLDLTQSMDFGHKASHVYNPVLKKICACDVRMEGAGIVSMRILCNQLIEKALGLPSLDLVHFNLQSQLQGQEEENAKLPKQLLSRNKISFESAGLAWTSHKRCMRILCLANCVFEGRMII